MKILKYLMISLVLFVASCSSDNDDDNVIPNGYPKEVTIEVKVYSAKNEKIEEAYFSYLHLYSKTGDKVATEIERIDDKEISLPFNKKGKYTVHYFDVIGLNVGALDKTKEFFAELLIDGEVVKRQSSFELLEKSKQNVASITYLFK